MTYDVENPDPGLKQEQKSGWVKPFNGIPTLTSLCMLIPFNLFMYAHPI